MSCRPTKNGCPEQGLIRGSKIAATVALLMGVLVARRLPTQTGFQYIREPKGSSVRVVAIFLFGMF
jgi:hypothetical protein